MSKHEADVVRYIVMCAFEFARRYGLPVQDAMRYLLDHSGISYLDTCYEAEHTLSLDDTLDALADVCRRAGGRLA